MIAPALFSSAKDDWGTPQWFFDYCNERFGPFDLDAAASKENAKCPRFLGKDQHALLRAWEGEKVWCNPPYGRGVTGKWVKQAWLQSNSREIVMLLPARTDTLWFDDYIINAANVYFIKGRLMFEGAKDPAPFPSMVIHYAPHIDSDNCSVTVLDLGHIRPRVPRSKGRRRTVREGVRSL